MSKLFNRKDTKDKRKNLRKTMTKAEVFLWQGLKGRQLQGFKFRRQHGIGDYIVDFYCPEAEVAIEIDGGVHEYLPRSEYDLKRQHVIESYGITILRYRNEQVLTHRDGVLQEIARHCKDKVR